MISTPSTSDKCERLQPGQWGSPVKALMKVKRFKMASRSSDLQHSFIYKLVRQQTHVHSYRPHIPFLNDLYCVGWGIKLYSLTQPVHSSTKLLT